MPRGDVPPSYGVAGVEGAHRPQAPYGPPEPRDAYGEGGHPRTGEPRMRERRVRDEYEAARPGSGVRGGHPEQREPGGGWGAGPAGRGPAGGNAPAGRVLQGTPGSALGAGRQSPGPRQEYIEAFEDDVFGRSAGGAASRMRAPAPRHPGAETRGGGRVPGPGAQGPGDRRPGPPGQWDGKGDGGPAVHQGGPDTGGLPRAAPPPRDPDEAGKGGGKGRVFTGVLALAVATVVALAVAGRLTGVGEPGSDGTEAGAVERGAAQEEPASRSDQGRAPEQVREPAQTYSERMGETFSLKPGFKGKGGFKAVGGDDEGAGGGDVVRYRVDVERGLPLDSELFARAVHKTLNDKRSWAHGGERSFERVAKGDAEFVVTLASSPTTDVWCAKSGLDTSEQNVSCDSASTDRIMINAYRWAQGSKTFGDDRIYSYRQMLINHEVGHRLGQNHVGCPRDGALAPVMMQQTKSLSTGPAKCRPNPWPYPRG